MSIFRCEKCGCIENTATSNFWHERKPLCSECDPEIGRWHGRFPKTQASGYLVGADGFLYHPDEKVRHTKITGKVPGELVHVPAREKKPVPPDAGESDEGD